MENIGTLDNQYIILEEKSVGRSTINYLARDNQTQDDYFISIKKPDYNGNDNFPADEIIALNFLHDVNNPYIVHFVRNGNGILALNNKPPKNVNYLVFEYVPGFCLFDCIYRENLTERHTKLLFRKILNGVQAMHNANICHRDIRPENIILDKNYNPKICNFGFASINAINLNDYIAGTGCYMAPEILENHPYDGYKADIFSLGQLLFILVTDMFGFKSSNPKDYLYSLIMSNQSDKYWNMRSKEKINPSNEFKDLFIRMVAYDPLQRPTIDQILNDPWMKELNDLNDNELNALENELRNELHNRETQFNNNLQLGLHGEDDD